MVNDNPLITVVTPVYNAESFIKETIESVLCQTFRDFEFLLLDDGSTDNSVDIIRSYNDPRICLIPCEHDFIRTVNQGYSRAKGKYIAQLDHDDLMMPYRLQIQYDFMETHPTIAACGGWMHCFGKRTHVISMPTEHEQIVLDMLLHGPILNPTGFVRKQFLVEHQLKHQSEYSIYADFKLWSEVSKRGQLANIPQILTLYRTSNEQATEKYASECSDILTGIKLEVLDYLLSRLTDVEHPAAQYTHQVLPLLQQLKEKELVSVDTYLFFMYEMISSLIKKVEI